MHDHLYLAVFKYEYLYLAVFKYEYLFKTRFICVCI